MSDTHNPHSTESRMDGKKEEPCLAAGEAKAGAGPMKVEAGAVEVPAAAPGTVSSWGPGGSQADFDAFKAERMPHRVSGLRTTRPAPEGG